MDYGYNMPAQQGWQCPVCKRVYSPMTSMCLYCGKQETVSAETNTKDFATSYPYGMIRNDCQTSFCSTSAKQ